MVVSKAWLGVEVRVAEEYFWDWVCCSQIISLLLVFFVQSLVKLIYGNRCKLIVIFLSFWYTFSTFIACIFIKNLIPQNFCPKYIAVKSI